MSSGCSAQILNQTDGASNRILGLLAVAERVLELVRIEECAGGVGADERVFRVVLEKDLIVEGQGVLLQIAAKFDKSWRTGEPSVVEFGEHRLNGFTRLLIVAAGLGGLVLGPLDLGAELNVVPIGQADEGRDSDEDGGRQ